MLELSVREIQELLLDCLVRVTAACDTLRIPYFLDYGTLLGARRHGGFIPWDDDADIAIPQFDYPRFIEQAPGLLGPGLRVDTNAYGLRFLKVAIEGIQVIEDSPLLDTDTINGELSLDIFPLVSLRRPFGLQRAAQFASYASVIQSTSATQWRRVRGEHPWKARILRAMSGIPESVAYELPKHWVERPEPLNPDHLIGHAFGLGEGFGPEYLPYSEFFPLSRITFEGIEFSAPHDVDEYLTLLYGAWQAIPEQENRTRHLLWAGRA